MTTIDRSQQLASLHTGELQPLIAELEQRRRYVRQRMYIAIGVGVLVALLALVVARWIGSFSFYIGLALALLAWGLITGGPYKAYRSHFKREILGRLVALVDPNLHYDPDGGIDRNTFWSSGIYRTGIDRYSYEDSFSGVVGATSFRFSEVHAEYKTTTTDSKGNTRTQWHTIFRGIFFVADFNKHFQGQTFVLPDTAERALGGLGRWLQSLSSAIDSRPGELVQMEDPTFERLFAVYSTDQVEARYILSPSLMERLVALRNDVGDKMAVSFVDSCIFIAIPTTKNRFEPPSIWARSADLSLEELESYMRDIRLAEEIVAELNLNTRIWSKR